MTTKLYYAPGACSLASHIALAESGIPYETQRVNTKDGEQRKPEYLRINPRGRVPALVVDGKVLTENMAILTYIGGGYPQAGLWPKKTWDQAQAVSALAWFADTVHPAFGHLFRPERYVDGEDHQQAVKAKGRTVYEGYLREIDSLLEGRKYFMGRQFTVVDGYLPVFYRWANRTGVPVKELKNYTRAVELIAGRPKVAKVLADEGITLDK